jgi:hypothetical protein
MSDKTFAQKLRIRDNQRLLLLNAPKGFGAKLGDVPPGVSILSRPTKPIDVTLFFVTSRKALTERLPSLKPLAESGALWVVYPKGTSEMKADVNRDVIANFALEIGMKGVALVAVDDTWSALRLKLT